MITLYESARDQLISVFNSEYYFDLQCEEFTRSYSKLLESDELHLGCLSLRAYKKNYQARKKEFIDSYQGYGNEKEFIQSEKVIISGIDSMFDIPIEDLRSNLITYELLRFHEAESEKIKILNYLDDINDRMNPQQETESGVINHQVDDLNNKSTANRLRVLYLLGFFTDNILSKKNKDLVKYVKFILDTESDLNSHISAIKNEATDNTNHPQYSDTLFDQYSDRLKKAGFIVVEKLENHK
jgi:hypothetical protein